uniref:peptidylprolyl isomerase n=2 Tax=Macrostomum lignano TaxID=282301 RepID=A0A1I8HVA8_9PLAT
MAPNLTFGANLSFHAPILAILRRFELSNAGPGFLALFSAFRLLFSDPGADLLSCADLSFPTLDPGFLALFSAFRLLFSDPGADLVRLDKECRQPSGQAAISPSALRQRQSALEALVAIGQNLDERCNDSLGGAAKHQNVAAGRPSSRNAILADKISDGLVQQGRSSKGTDHSLDALLPCGFAPSPVQVTPSDLCVSSPTLLQAKSRMSIRIFEINRAEAFREFRRVRSREKCCRPAVDEPVTQSISCKNHNTHLRRRLLSIAHTPLVGGGHKQLSVRPEAARRHVGHRHGDLADHLATLRVQAQNPRAVKAGHPQPPICIHSQTPKPLLSETPVSIVLMEPPKSRPNRLPAFGFIMAPAFVSRLIVPARRRPAGSHLASLNLRKFLVGGGHKQLSVRPKAAGGHVGHRHGDLADHLATLRVQAQNPRAEEAGHPQPPVRIHSQTVRHASFSCSGSFAKSIATRRFEMLNPSASQSLLMEPSRSRPNRLPASGFINTAASFSQLIVPARRRPAGSHLASLNLSNGDDEADTAALLFGHLDGAVVIIRLTPQLIANGGRLPLYITLGVPRIPSSPVTRKTLPACGWDGGASRLTCDQPVLNLSWLAVVTNSSPSDPKQQEVTLGTGMGIWLTTCPLCGSRHRTREPKKQATHSRPSASTARPSGTPSFSCSGSFEKSMATRRFEMLNASASQSLIVPARRRPAGSHLASLNLRKFRQQILKFLTLYCDDPHRMQSSTTSCYLRLEANSVPLGRLEFRLFATKVPLTCRNFASLCVGHENGCSGYRGSRVHRCIPGFAIQAGDFQSGNGTGGWSIYGRYFPDEDLTGRHDRRGLLSMANSGPDTNSSQFLITLAPCPWMDGRHVVFGELTSGWDVLQRAEDLGTPSGRPTKLLVIADCGVSS